MKRALLPALCCVAAALLGFSHFAKCEEEWKAAEPGWRYEFPRDHRIHPEFKTEWWYFTGNLFDDSGARFGYELTFFRQGIRPLKERDPQLSRFVVDDLKFAHFTMTDVAGRRFRFTEKASRGAFGEAGFTAGQRVAWIEDWVLVEEGEHGFGLTASMPEATLRLQLRTTQPPVVHGTNGISAKASVPGYASHYYSLTRLATSGELTIDGKAHQVRGESWFDHEWATNQLAPGQVGWDWLSVQFDHGGELMLYQMRLDNGAADPASSGTLTASDGSSVHLPSTAFRMTPMRFWKSKTTGANYPIGWTVELVDQQLQFAVRAVLEDQEVALTPLVYWEGAIDVEGTRNGHPIKGRGYLELTGYARPLQGLGR